MRARDIARYRKDPLAFRCEQIFLENGRRYGDVIEPWQADDHRPVDAGMNTYRERPRGESKTGDLGTDAVTQLLLGPAGQRCYCAAADEDQARLLFDDVAGKLQRNPLLLPSVSVLKKEIRVRSTGSRLIVLAADIASSWGLRPDWIGVDEISEWSERLRAFWHALISATGKRRHCRVHVISSAGWDKSSLAWEVRELARTEPGWHLSARGHCARWISEEWREQQRRTLPAHVYARLHEARWVDGVGAFLTAEEVDAIFAPIPDGRAGRLAIGLDIGLSRDRTACAVVRNVGGLVVVEHLLTWSGKPGRKVALETVEAEVKTLADKFRAPVYLDPYQGVLMAQRLQTRGVQVVEYQFSGEARHRLFSTILDLVRTRRLRSQPHEALRRELLGLEVEQTAAGWRVDHKAGRFDDHVVAVALAAQAVAGEPVDLTQAFKDAHESVQESSVADSFPSLADETLDSPWTFHRF